MDLPDLGKTPVSKNAPAGKDARSTPELEALSSEMEKLSSPTASEEIDWRRVADLSARILSEQSKDLLAACYLSAALLHLEGIGGLGKGVRILRDLMEHFWETMFPPVKRMRGRRNALDWWMEKILAGLEAFEPASVAQEEVASLLEDLKAIDAFLGKLMEEAPVLSTLIGRVAGLRVSVETGKEDQPQIRPGKKPVDARPAPAFSPPPPLPVSMPAKEQVPAALKTEEDAERALRAVLQKLGDLASFYMSRDLYHPLGYLLARAAAWTTVIRLPPSKDSKTLIPPPPDYVRSALEKLNRDGDWENLLKSAEARIGEFLFWLDLSHAVAESLDRLGRADLCDLVSRETAVYAERLNGIEELCFSDGTPFANQETRAWLKRISPGRTQLDPGPRMSGAPDSLEASIESEYEKALELTRDRKVHEALLRLHGRISSSSSGRERLLWRMALSRLLVSAREERTALPHLRDILGDVDQYRLEHWDPDLALRALLDVYIGMRTLKDDNCRKQALEVLDRIAALNPAEALRIKK